MSTALPNERRSAIISVSTLCGIVNATIPYDTGTDFQNESRDQNQEERREVVEAVVEAPTRPQKKRKRGKEEAEERELVRIDAECVLQESESCTSEEVKSILDLSLCQICFEIPLEPMNCCGDQRHVFCRGCLESSLQRKRECPSCRSRNVRLSHSETISWNLRRLRVSCPTFSHFVHDSPCRWKGSLDEVKEHLRFDCRIQKCDICSFVGELETHTTDVCLGCEMSRFGCNYVSSTRENIELHRFTCSMSSIVLSNVVCMRSNEKLWYPQIVNELIGRQVEKGYPLETLYLAIDILKRSLLSNHASKSLSSLMNRAVGFLNILNEENGAQFLASGQSSTFTLYSCFCHFKEIFSLDERSQLLASYYLECTLQNSFAFFWDKDIIVLAVFSLVEDTRENQSASAFSKELELECKDSKREEILRCKNFLKRQLHMRYPQKEFQLDEVHRKYLSPAKLQVSREAVPYFAFSGFSEDQLERIGNHRACFLCELDICAERFEMTDSLFWNAMSILDRYVSRVDGTLRTKICGKQNKSRQPTFSDFELVSCCVFIANESREKSEGINRDFVHMRLHKEMNKYNVFMDDIKKSLEYEVNVETIYGATERLIDRCPALFGKSARSSLQLAHNYSRDTFFLRFPPEKVACSFLLAGLKKHKKEWRSILKQICSFEEEELLRIFSLPDK